MAVTPAARPERSAKRPVRAWSDPLRWLMLPWTLAVTYPLILVSTTLFGTLAVTLSLISKHLGFYAGVFWARSLTWGTWVRVRVAGREHLAPEQSYVILSNHQGAYDILALYGFLGREFRWVMKEELRKVPFLGWGCAAIGHIFVDRAQLRPRHRQPRRRQEPPHRRRLGPPLPRRHAQRRRPPAAVQEGRLQYRPSARPADSPGVDHRFEQDPAQGLPLPQTGDRAHPLPPGDRAERRPRHGGAHRQGARRDRVGPRAGRALRQTFPGRAGMGGRKPKSVNW